MASSGVAQSPCLATTSEAEGTGLEPATPYGAPHFQSPTTCPKLLKKTAFLKQGQHLGQQLNRKPRTSTPICRPSFTLGLTYPK